MENHVVFPGLGLELDISRVAFSIGDFNVYWYGVIIAVGFCLGGTVGIGTVIALTLYGPSLQCFLPVAQRLARLLRLPAAPSPENG